MGDPSNKAICKEVVSSVLPKLEGMAKWLFISADELKELQKLTVERNNIIGFAVSCVENKFAKSILALLINPYMGSPAFIARLLPVFQLNSDFLKNLLYFIVKVEKL